MMRPVEHMTYYKTAHVTLLQPFKFVMNLITLIIMLGLTWAPTGSRYYHNREEFVTALCVTVILSGMFNLFELINYFYVGKIRPDCKLPGVTPQDAGSNSTPELPLLVSFY